MSIIEVVHDEESMVGELFRVGHLSLETTPNILAQCVVLYTEGDCGAAGKSSQFQVRTSLCLGEESQMGDLHDSGDVDKVFDHVLGSDFDVAGSVGFHHLSEVCGKLFHKLASLTPEKNEKFQIGLWTMLFIFTVFCFILTGISLSIEHHKK